MVAFPSEHLRGIAPEVAARADELEARHALYAQQHHETYVFRNHWSIRLIAWLYVLGSVALVLLAGVGLWCLVTGRIW